MKTEKNKKNAPGRPPAGKALTPAAVAEAAAQLIDAEGVEQFSMRRLGQMLGVEAMALYNHFEDKEAILDATASVVLARIPGPASKGSWRKRVKELAHNIRTLAHGHPKMFRLAMTRREVPQAGLALVEATLAALADAGLSAEAQAIGYRTLFLYIRGFCLWEIEEFGPTRDLRSHELTSQHNEHPYTIAAKEPIFAPDLDRQFEAGLELILRGLSA